MSAAGVSPIRRDAILARKATWTREGMRIMSGSAIIAKIEATLSGMEEYDETFGDLIAAAPQLFDALGSIEIMLKWAIGQKMKLTDAQLRDLLKIAQDGIKQAKASGGRG